MDHEVPKMKPKTDIDALANYIQIQTIRGEKSRFHAYVNALPDDVDLAFRRPTSEIVARLPPSWVQEVVNQRYAVYMRGKQLGDVETYVKRVSVVHSRVFVVRALDRRRNEWIPSPALVAGADMLNLSEHPNTDCETDVDSVFFECKTIKPIDAGEQLFTPFGRQFASEEDRDAYTLVHYGFAQNDFYSASANRICTNYARMNINVK